MQWATGGWLEWCDASDRETDNDLEDGLTKYLVNANFRSVATEEGEEKKERLDFRGPNQSATDDGALRGERSLKILMKGFSRPALVRGGWDGTDGKIA